MTRYETLMLATPDINQESISKLEQYVSDLSSKSKGKLLSFDVWGKYKLSFPVKKHDYGVYILARFELEDDVTGTLEEFKTFFKIKYNDIIMRSLNRTLSEDDSLEYQKPEAIVAGEHCVSINSDTKEDASVDNKKETSSEGSVKEAVLEDSPTESSKVEDVQKEDALEKEGK
jgi:small subunit ribosomal protein S6